MMKINNTILQAVFVGASLAAVSSCSLTDVVIPQEGSDKCTTECIEGSCDHSEGSDKSGETWNCPACGMG